MEGDPYLRQEIKSWLLWTKAKKAYKKEAYDLQLGLLYSRLHFYSSYPCRIPNIYLAQA